jgi:hypothetical protein
MVGFIRAFSFELQKGTESYQGLFVYLKRIDWQRGNACYLRAEPATNAV